jgi:hypothetical protein
MDDRLGRVVTMMLTPVAARGVRMLRPRGDDSTLHFVVGQIDDETVVSLTCSVAHFWMASGDDLPGPFCWPVPWFSVDAADEGGRFAAHLVFQQFHEPSVWLRRPFKPAISLAFFDGASRSFERMPTRCLSKFLRQPQVLFLDPFQIFFA